jgi:YidC/Oxa1 family membrane protein insertase
VISAFIAIRKMCNLPVESFTTGGALWFNDLTIADPTYILPIISTGSILLMIHV